MCPSPVRETEDRLPLRRGDRGGAVADLQRRLGSLGSTVDPDELGVFSSGTRAAVEAFQHRRGLRVDGVCGTETWAALVEAGYRLGDRTIYHRRPMLRGDDVAHLQQRLSALGFDTGRVDGIFGPLTASALQDFQVNCRLVSDGILGPVTLRELRRVTPRHPEALLASTVRDRERLLQSLPTLRNRRIAIAESGGLDPLIAALRRRLTPICGHVLPILQPRGSGQAAAANAADADVLLSLRLDPEIAGCRVAYYAGFSYESPGGKRLASLLASRLASTFALEAEPIRGMTLPALRESRMPAVLCELGPPELVVEHIVIVAESIASALEAWATGPVE